MSETARVCDTPGCEKPAAVHLTQVVDNKMSNHYLCAACAKAKGIATKAPPSFDLSDFLAQLGEDKASSSTTISGEPCTFCGLTFRAFKETGRLGCAHCYASFEGNLRRLLNRIHGSSQHLGKVYLPPNPQAAERDKRIGSLRRRLHRAVEGEDFERAAALRDEIRALERTG